jgi:hypothetical protein
VKRPGCKLCCTPSTELGNGEATHDQNVIRKHRDI